MKTEIQNLFCDAAEEFYDANEILKTFYSLKMQDADTYKDAFINVCLPKVRFFEYYENLWNNM